MRDESYERGYEDGLQRRQYEIERLSLLLQSLQARYDYLMQIHADALAFTPPFVLIRKTGTE